MTASSRATERGCILPLSLVGAIHGVTRQTLNNVFNSDKEKFDKMIDESIYLWNSICKKTQTKAAKWKK